MQRRTLAGVVALALIAGGAVLARRFDPRVVREDVIVIDTPTTRLRQRDTARFSALLVHGITSSRESMLVLGEALAREGFEVRCIDLPGHGDSARGYDFGAAAGRVHEAAWRMGGADVVVGHSLGAGVTAHLLAHGPNGFSPPRLFVALGAVVETRSTPVTQVLLATGRLDVLAPPAWAQRMAARTGAQVLIGPSDHVLEPFDPVLVRGIVNASLAAVGAPPRPEGTPLDAPLRALGALLVLLAAPLVAVAVPARRAEGAPEAALEGGLAGALCVALVVLALDGAFVGLRPHLRHVLPLAALTTLAVLAPAALGALAARVRPLGPVREALVGQLLVVGGACLLGLACAGAGQLFFAMVSMIVALVAAGATGIGAVVARRARHALAGHVAFGVIVAYAPALAAPVFV